MFRSSTFKFVVVALMTLAPVAAATPSTTASVTLGGSVTSSLSIASTPTGTASALNLSGGRKIVKVADLAISTNNEQGVTLTASSGNLTKTNSVATGAGTAIAYQVTSVDDGASAPDATAFTVDSGDDYTVGNTTSGAFDQDLFIMYTPLALQDPGSYGSTINLSVADN